MEKHSFADIQFEIANMLDVPDEELTEEQRQLMDQYLNELGQQEASKIDSFSGFIRQQSAYAEAIKEEAQRLSNRARAIQNKIESMKQYYLGIMQRYNLKKVSGEVYSIGVRENTRVEVKDIEALKSMNNPEFLKTEIEYKPNKPAIKEFIKAGYEIPGCYLEKSYSLNIR